MRRRDARLTSRTIRPDAPLRIVVGISFLSTTCEVSAPPHLEAGAWKMMIDGVELTRIPKG